MKPDIITVTQTSKKARQVVKNNVMVRIVVQRGYTAPRNTIEVDTLSGLTDVQKRQTPLVSIILTDVERQVNWTGTFQELADRLV